MMKYGCSVNGEKSQLLFQRLILLITDQFGNSKVLYGAHVWYRQDVTADRYTQCFIMKNYAVTGIWYAGIINLLSFT